MPSLHQQLMRDCGAPVLREAFVERDEFDVEKPVWLTLHEGDRTTQWAASVGPAKPLLIWIDKIGQQMRLTVELVGPTDELPHVGLNERTKVYIHRYGAPAFQVFPDMCEYGSVRTKLTVIRQVMTIIGNNQTTKGN